MTLLLITHSDNPRPLNFADLVETLDGICGRIVSVRAWGWPSASFLETCGVLVRGMAIRTPSSVRFAAYTVGPLATLALSESAVIAATKTGPLVEISLRGGGSMEVSTDEADVLGLVAAGEPLERD
jgi:hypothetical protein